MPWPQDSTNRRQKSGLCGLCTSLALHKLSAGPRAHLHLSWHKSKWESKAKPYVSESMITKQTGRVCKVNSRKFSPWLTFTNPALWSFSTSSIQGWAVELAFFVEAETNSNILKPKELQEKCHFFYVCAVLVDRFPGIWQHAEYHEGHPLIWDRSFQC